MKTREEILAKIATTPSWSEPLNWVLDEAPIITEPLDERTAALTLPAYLGSVSGQFLIPGVHVTHIANPEEPYLFLRGDLWTGVKWLLAKLYYDIPPAAPKQDKRAVIYDASKPTQSGEPRHPINTHNWHLTDLDLGYLTTGPSNWTSGVPRWQIPFSSAFSESCKNFDAVRMSIWMRHWLAVFPRASIIMHPAFVERLAFRDYRITADPEKLHIDHWHVSCGTEIDWTICLP